MYQQYRQQSDPNHLPQVLSLPTQTQRLHALTADPKGGFWYKGQLT